MSQRGKQKIQRRPESAFLNEARKGQHVLKVLVRLPMGLDDPEARMIATGICLAVNDELPKGAKPEATLRRHGDKHGNLMEGFVAGLFGADEVMLAAGVRAGFGGKSAMAAAQIEAQVVGKIDPEKLRARSVSGVGMNDADAQYGKLGPGCEHCDHKGYVQKMHCKVSCFECGDSKVIEHTEGQVKLSVRRSGREATLEASLGMVQSGPARGEPANQHGELEGKDE